MGDLENEMSIEELRREVRTMWDRERALNRDLLDLPEVPSIETMLALSQAAMSTRNPNVMAIGKLIQRKQQGVPYKTEFECATGLWSLMRSGLIAARNAQNVGISTAADLG